MNRLQKKCFIAATGLHLFLVLLLFIGPAFITTKSTTEEVPVIEFVPMITTDSNASGGGDPKGGSPPPPAPKQENLPIPPAPAPPAPKVEKPQPPQPKADKAEEVVPPNEKSDIVESKKAPRNSNKIELGKPVVRNAQDLAKARAEAQAKAAAAERAERQRIASAFNRATRGLSDNLSGETSIVLKGPGGGGVPYGNWLAGVKKVYTDAWIVPDGVADDSATVAATVTIGRNGDVLSSGIARSSGNALVDHSVKATLDRVRSVPPLPDGAKEDQRTVTINFNVKAKQGLG
ncbi:MAG: TonB family protein [Verrucomicrobiota bacterium]